MPTNIRLVNVLFIAVIGAFLAVSSFKQSSVNAIATGVVAAQPQIETALAVYEGNDTVALASSLSVSVSGCESSGTGDVGCLAAVHGGSGQLNYWWEWEGPGHLFQTNSDYVSIIDCLDGEGSLTVQVLDRGTNQERRSSPYRVMCDCSPGNDACDIDIFGEVPCWPELGFCG